MNINTWIGCRKIEVVDWYDGKNFYIHVDEYAPGQSIEQPPKMEVSALIEKTPENEYRLTNFLDSISRGLIDKHGRSRETIDKYHRAKEFLLRKLTVNDKHYEIVEDSYEYDNGLLLIIYNDKEHENEREHYCVNVDSF